MCWGMEFDLSADVYFEILASNSLISLPIHLLRFFN